MEETLEAMKLTRTIELQLHERRAGDKRVFAAVLSTEQPVKRQDWERGEYFEVLSHKADAIESVSRAAAAPRVARRAHAAGRHRGQHPRG